MYETIIEESASRILERYRWYAQPSEREAIVRTRPGKTFSTLVWLVNQISRCEIFLLVSMQWDFVILHLNFVGSS